MSEEVFTQFLTLKTGISLRGAKRRVRWVITLNLWLWNLIHMSIQVLSDWAWVSKPQAFFPAISCEFSYWDILSLSLSFQYMDLMMIVYLYAFTKQKSCILSLFFFFGYCHQNIKIVWGFKGYQFNYNLAQYITITLAKIKSILNAMCVVCCSEEKWYLVVRTYELLSAFVGLFPDLSFFRRESSCLVYV